MFKTEEDKKKAYELLEETRNLYYDAEWNPLDTRCMNPEHDSISACLYKPPKGSASTGCAIGRLAPELDWTEGYGCDDVGNYELTSSIIQFLERAVDNVTFARFLQTMHDEPAIAAGAYKEALEFLDYQKVRTCQ